MKKRFLAFGFEYYDAGGGWNDFLGSFATAEEALNRINTGVKRDHFQIIDLETEEEVPVHFLRYGFDANGRYHAIYTFMPPVNIPLTDVDPADMIGVPVVNPGRVEK